MKNPGFLFCRKFVKILDKVVKITNKTGKKSGVLNDKMQLSKEDGNRTLLSDLR